MKRIVIGCDCAAVGLKKTIKEFAESLQYEVIDVGVDSEEDTTYYPLIAKRLCEEIIASGYTLEGILLCGTGIGMAMTANKFPGIYAAVCHDGYSAERAKLSNNGNVLCMGARVIGPELAKKVAGEWLSLTFRDGSSTPKVAAMRQIDVENRAV